MGRFHTRNVMHTPFVLLLLLAMFVVAATAGGGGGKGSASSSVDTIADVELAGIDDDSANEAPNEKFVEPIPRYYPLPYFFVKGVPIGYMVNLGPSVGLLVLLMDGLWFFVTYVIFAASTDSNLLVADYGIINARPILANHGALGGYITCFGAGMYFVGGIFVGYMWKTAIRRPYKKPPEGKIVIASDPDSWQYSHLYLEHYVGTYLTRCLIPASWCMRPDPNATGPTEQAAHDKLNFDRTPTAAMNNSTMLSTFMSSSPMDRVTFAPFAYFLILVKMVEVAAHAGDIWTVASFSWVGVAVIVVVTVATMCFYPMYVWGDYILFSACPKKAFVEIRTHLQKHGQAVTRPELIELVRDNCARVHRHVYNRLEFFPPLFLCLVLFMTGMSIFYSVMDAENAYTHSTIFAISRAEHRTLLRSNVKWEAISAAIVGGVLFFGGFIWARVANPGIAHEKDGT